MKLVIAKEKIVISVLCVWSFINTYILLKRFRINQFRMEQGYGNSEYYSPFERFYPFTFSKTTHYNSNTGVWDDISNIEGASDMGFSHYFDIRFYDYTEYFIYVIGFWMIYFLYRYLKGGK